MQSDKLREEFETHVDGEGWDLQRMPSGAYHSKRTADALVIWQAARKAALEEVRAELERRYQAAWEAWKVRFEGAHAEGQVDALDAAEGYVEGLIGEPQ